MNEIQGMITFLAGLVGLGLLMEAVKAFIWAVVLATVFRRYGLIARKRKDGPPWLQ